MKTTRYTIVALGWLLVLTAAAMADSSVDELQLSRVNDEVVLKINISGSYQFRHQIEEAKDGRPFRVIVDVFPARHNLGRNSFSDLPATPVSAIRTSQFAVDPEKVVRVVLDLNRESVYRIAKQGSSVYVYIPDKSGGSFAAWTSRVEAGPEVTPASAEPPPEVSSPPPVAQKPVEKAAPEPIPPKTPDYNNTYQSTLLEREMVEVESVVEETPPVEKKVSAPVEEPVEVTPEKAAPSEPIEKEDRAPEVEKKHKTYASNAEPVTPSAIEATPERVEAEEPVPVAAKPAEETPDEEATKPTSRFRRKPAFPAKLKGTIVAEFPTRMVIQYRPGVARDPFATLIDDNKRSKSPYEERLVDVETARLVGVLENADGENRALVEDRKGYGYILEPGDRIMKGYVSQIYADRALFQIFEYGWSRSIALSLNESE